MSHPSGPLLAWAENGTLRQARWRSASDRPPPGAVHLVADGMSADQALARAAAGQGLLWRGDFPQACQLLDAIRRRRRPRPGRRGSSIAEQFRRERQQRSHTAGLLGALLVELRPGGTPLLRRAPQTAAAIAEVLGAITEPSVISLRELLGLLNVHRQRRVGIPVGVLDGARIHPHFGVFAPTRQDYLELVARAPLPDALGARAGTAFDIGTGTGVLSALLVARGLRAVVATDNQPRAVACARDNLARLGLSDVVDVRRHDLFPAGRAELIVANPPWLPGTPAGPAETGVYDRRGAMTDRFLRGLTDHLAPAGEAWLIQSTLAEHLGLRPWDHLDALIDRSGLSVIDRLEMVPTTAHRPRDDGPVARARRHERLQLWRLAVAAGNSVAGPVGPR